MLLAFANGVEHVWGFAQALMTPQELETYQRGGYLHWGLFLIISESVVRVDGVSVPTTFVNIRTLKARIPTSAVARALPNRFNEPGPFQLNGVYGDRTVKITVFNRPPDGGTSNSVSLRVQAKWLRREPR